MNPRYGLLAFAGLIAAMLALQACGTEPPAVPSEESAPAAARESLQSRDVITVSGVREVEDTVTSATNASETGDTSGDTGGASDGEPESSALAVPEGVSPELVQDSQMYAAQFGVSLEEAVKRLMLQGPVGELNGELKANESETFSGLWIQHEPEYAVVVMFTQDGEHTISQYVPEGPLKEIIEVRHGEATLRELEESQSTAIEIARGLGFQVGAGIDVFENRAELYTSDRTALEAALSENGLTLPDHVLIVQQ